MRRMLRAEEARLWRAVAASVEPLPGRTLPSLPPAAASSPKRPQPPAPPTPAPARPTAPPARKGEAAPQGIEPNRERRIAIGRESIGARLDLHGLSQDRARATLESFLLRAHAAGIRAVLVITGQGRAEGGVLRRRLPDWLSEAPLRAVVAGVSRAHRRHGGEGAFYVALRRKA